MIKINSLKNDFFGGVTAAVVALPLALAFGVASGAGPTAGLYGAIVLGFFASLFGGVPTQISGPTGPMTVVTATAIVAFPDDFQSVISVIFLAGLIQISFGIIKIGKWVKYIPYPVISGFMSGIGIIIIILQINPFLGVESKGSIIETLIAVPKNFAITNMDSIILASITLVIMFFTPKKISKIIPSALIALVIVTLLSFYLNFEVPTIGQIPMGLPEITIPTKFNILQLNTIITLAITLALLGSIDTLLTSLVADSMTKTNHKPNKELIAQGIGNALCSFVGAIPGAGATMRTVINIKSGGESRLSGMIHSVTLLLIVLFFAPLASKIPLSVLAGVLIKVGFDILDYKFLKIMNRIPKVDLLIMLTVFFLTIFVDLIMAVGAGITFASIIAIYKVSKRTRMQTKNMSKKIKFDISIDNKETQILEIDGSLFFGTASILDRKIDKIRPQTKFVILDCLKVHFIDLSAIFIIEEEINKLKAKDIQTILILKHYQKRKLLKLDVNDIFKNTVIVSNIDSAVNTIQHNEYNENK
ncbi:SulP family inorganic anion transporter [Halarcobacter ebronensis]|uniref:Sulfate permease n=1 Tax=Halarcobacter ebronensis TaxID=1462615 RepID=A0A4Q1ALH5_9BACT|nr:SulP family inorganic anion transporter [Halarcobacter ebronensis]QKF82073.1 sulfate permease [Halarcobacter ebronensis]RXK04095.1 sulfate permease [Halarcobacter ebronensis]